MQIKLNTFAWWKRLKAFDYHYKYLSWPTRYFIFELASSITAWKDVTKVVNYRATFPKCASNVHSSSKKNANKIEHFRLMETFKSVRLSLQVFIMANSLLHFWISFIYYCLKRCYQSRKLQGNFPKMCIKCTFSQQKNANKIEHLRSIETFKSVRQCSKVSSINRTIFSD
jgi:hypothetical protein